LPYLLGGRQNSADFGLVRALPALVAWDPDPFVLEMQRAQRIWQWNERTNGSVLDASWDRISSQELSADDVVPSALRALSASVGAESLIAAIAQMAADDAGCGDHPVGPRASSCRANRSIGSVTPPRS
jgi:hypothetical protein